MSGEFSNNECDSDYAIENDLAKLKSEEVILLTPEEQLAFWQALQRPVKLTAEQRELGRIMRGEI